MRTFHKYNDSGHGWLKVRLEDIVKAGVIEKITPYSYRSACYGYLEEDQDMWVYLQAVGFDREKDRIKDHYTTHSHIRNYNSFGRWQKIQS